MFLLLELGSFLISLRTFGVMLIMFALRVKFSPVEVSVLFLGLSSQFREFRCGVLFWLYLGVANLGVVRHVGRSNLAQMVACPLAVNGVELVSSRF